LARILFLSWTVTLYDVTRVYAVVKLGPLRSER